MIKRENLKSKKESKSARPEAQSRNFHGWRRARPAGKYAKSGKSRKSGIPRSRKQGIKSSFQEDFAEIRQKNNDAYNIQ